MSNLIQYGYVSGEISPTLYSRSDLEKYDLGLALARDYFVDYRGGISTRAGSEFKEWMAKPDKTIRWIPFEFSPNVANTNLVIFGDGYIRFAQGGNYILEAEKTVTSLVLGTVTSAGHGFTSGDLGRFTDIAGPVSYRGRLFEIVVTGTDTFTLKDQFNNTVTDPALFISGKFARVYTLVSPYVHTDLPTLNFEQIRDTLRLTHYKYKTRDLTRFGAVNWTITETQFGTQVQTPGGLTSTPSAAGTSGVVYTVTAVDQAGGESLPAEPTVQQFSVNFTSTAGSVLVAWSPVPGAAYYNIYRSTVSNEGSRASRAQQLGFAGRAYGTNFIDNNIIPDFTRLPPQFNNPFADLQIKWIDVVTPGTGYSESSLVSVADPNGTGFSGFVAVDPSGGIIGIVVVNGGKGYTSPTVSVSGGSGATFSVEIGPNAENYPNVSAVFQQRQVYGGTTESPLGLWGSRPKRFNNFDFSPIVVDNDSYAFEVDAAKVSMIQHLFPMRGGLLVMNDIGVWQLSGGNQVAVTATNALAEPQSYTGISPLRPIKIETDLLYVESKGYTVRLLSYNDLAKIYGGTDISILSAHFFGKGKELVSWTFAQEPYKLVHAVREDGYRLLGTIVKDQNVFAWTLTSTKGYYKQALTIREDRVDRVYLDVARLVQGKLVRYIELEAEREFTAIEDAWCLDSALALKPNYPNSTLTIGKITENSVVVTTSTSEFTPDDVDSIIFAAGGKLKITAYSSPTKVICQIRQPFTQFIPQSTTPIVSTPGLWTKDVPVKTISGLWHLEGQEVSILGDGNVFPVQTVVNGSITLTSGVVRAIVGLSYKCIARTLSPTASSTILEGDRKRILGLVTRVNNSRGLKAGIKPDQLYEMKERTNELYGEPILPHSDMRYVSVEPEWDINGQTYYVVEDPLPVTILGHVLKLEQGDDPN
ncbi:MAG: hypothetical protein E6R03_06410 [Hyphomicrobiaceae bacterium]|nr:MAG: hypothetical protein E6R03_06410 [Hyphomicrobiaceae bacterium]